MKRLVVHIGPPKTATTYFQQALFTNTDVLAAHGVYLPQTGRTELAPKAFCHHHLAWELMGSPRFRPDIGGWDALTGEIADVDAETVLISSEVLSPGTIASQQIGDLLEERLRPSGWAVTILYVVRDQVSLINSSYAQQVKTFTDVDDFALHVEAVLERGAADLEQQTSRWCESSDFEFVAVPFPALFEPNPLVTLLRAARIDINEDELVMRSEAVNITLGPIAVAAFRLLRHYLEGLNPDLSHDDMAVRKLHRVAARAAKDAGWCEEPFWGWTPALATEAVKRLGPTNERFARAVWGTAWPLPMPVDRPQAQVKLMDLRGRGLNQVQEFVVAMGKRYIRLLNEDEAATS